MIEIILAEGEAEALLRQFRHTGQNIECLLAIVRVDKPADRADVILEKIDKDRPVRRDRLGAHPHKTAWVGPTASLAVNKTRYLLGWLRSSCRNCGKVPIKSTLPPSSIAGMLAKFVSTVAKSASLMPCFRNIVRIAASLAEPIALVAMRLPLMSSIVLIGLSAATT